MDTQALIEKMNLRVGISLKTAEKAFGNFSRSMLAPKKTHIPSNHFPLLIDRRAGSKRNGAYDRREAFEKIFKE